MNKHLFHKWFAIGLLIMAFSTVGVISCKKKLPKEAPPPSSPKVEEVKPVPAPDTTGQAEREMQRLMDADKARIRAVYFDFDQSGIRSDQQSTLSTNAGIFRKWPTWQISVEGHCDERGTSEYNLALGERRASSTKSALIAASVDASRVSTVSFGEERPAEAGHNELAWSKNRRVEFRIK